MNLVLRTSRRPLTLVAAAVTGLALIGLGLTVVPPTGSPISYDAFTSVDPYGPSMPLVDGRRLVKYADGSTTVLHADTEFLDLGVAPPATSSEPQSNPVCGTTNVTWFFYAAASDMPAATYTSRYQNNIERIRGYVRQMNNKVYARSLSSSPSASPRPARLRVMCSGGAIRVGGIHLSMDSTQNSFAAIRQNLIDRGFHDVAYPNVKYVVFLDDPPLVATKNGKQSITCGLGETPLAEVRDVSHPANDTSYAVIWGNRGGNWQPCWHPVTALHELLHGMGAVGNGAPHTTGAGHCTDGLDIMCYNDSGPSGGQYTASTCPGTANNLDAKVLDCRDDDYFDTYTESSDSYLITSWNLGRSTNLFLQFG